MNVLQLVYGEFGLVERCFAFVLNDTTGQIELWEIMTSPVLADEIINPGAPQYYFDNIGGKDINITWSYESPLIFRPEDPRKPVPLRLELGEMFIDNLVGAAQFQLFWRPDSESCWQPWTTFSVCNNPGLEKPGYRSRLGFGEPPDTCDEFNDKPYRNGFWFQIKMIVSGYCSIKMLRFKATTIPALEFAEPVGCCPGEEVTETLEFA